MHQQSNSVHRLSNYRPQPNPAYTSNSKPFREASVNDNHTKAYQHKGTSDAVKGDANLFVPETIKADFDFEKSSQTVISANSPNSERTIETNNDSQWQDVFEDTNRTPTPANLPRATGVVTNKCYCNDEQSDDETDALPRMTRVNVVGEP